MSSDPAGPLNRALMRFVASAPGTWLFLNVIPHIDRPLLRLSRGRLSFSLGQPVLLLETRGARTGALRQTPLVYVADGERVVLVASNGGKPRHPAWYHNLCKNPAVRATLRGATRQYRARVAGGAERSALWQKALAVYAGYATYAERSGGREIPLVVLEPETPPA